MIQIPSEKLQIDLKNNQKVYFASDFHLGSPNYETSLIREKKIVKWLDEIKNDAKAVFLVGDLFDFWFEYKYVAPKGYYRFLGKLAELSDAGISIYLFTGNHDMWMFDFLPKELSLTIFRKPIELTINQTKIYIGHGDGLGPGDTKYKFLKLFFDSSICQWLFARVHPNLTFWVANNWSKSSRMQNHLKDELFTGEREWLYLYSEEVEKLTHFDYYIFGHRHLKLKMPLSNSKSTYYNIGEWFNECSYGVFENNQFYLKSQENSTI